MSASDSDPQFTVPDRYSPPFASVTDTDHTAWIYIATALGLALILLFGGIRVIVRGSICPGVGLDDYFLAASTVSFRHDRRVLRLTGTRVLQSFRQVLS